MARPNKSTVDYFPHNTEHRKTLFILQSKWGNDGYAVWFKILERLGSTEYHVLNLNEPTEFAYLAAYCMVSEETLSAILDQCAAVNAINPGFWRKKLVYSENFIKNITDAYRKRANKLPTTKKVKAIFCRFFPEETSFPAEETPKNEVYGVENGERERERGKYSPNSDEVRMSELLFSKILSRDKKAKKPNFQKWAGHIDKLMRLDKRSVEEIKSVIEWCQEDTFWKTNILSTEKLREKFGALIQKMGGNNHPQQPPKSKPKSSTLRDRHPVEIAEKLEVALLCLQQFPDKPDPNALALVKQYPEDPEVKIYLRDHG